tara:strand:+ start:824 stop:2074 length:1251 start_codon:yes stop_codon:yes gene_type:complete
MINFCIFEDNKYENLLPITETCPIYDIKVGISSNFEKFHAVFNYGNITLHCRHYLKPLVQKKYSDFAINNINSGSPCLFFNGRVLVNDTIIKKIKSIKDNTNTLFTYKGNLVACYLKGQVLNSFINFFESPPDNKDMISHIRKDCVTAELEDVDILEFSWDVISLNSAYINHDFNALNQTGIIKGDIKPFTIIYNEINVFIDEGCKIEDFVVLDATKGPIFIEKDTVINAHTRLEGPLYIGENSHILGGSIKNSSIANNCKISGEVSQCVIQNYTNKAHYGYLGNSYIGRWVNLGAGTTSSNLKSNYTNITIDYNKNTYDTGLQFLGSIIGDYSKTAVGTYLNAGTIINSACILLNHDFNHKFYPSFCWGSPTNKTRYDIDKFIKSLTLIKKRRKLDVSKVEEELFHFLFSKKSSS